MVKEIDWRIIAMGIVALMIIQIVAMLKGINGTFRVLIATIIALAIGVTIPQPKIK